MINGAWVVVVDVVVVVVDVVVVVVVVVVVGRLVVVTIGRREVRTGRSLMLLSMLFRLWLTFFPLLLAVN